MKGTACAKVWRCEPTWEPVDMGSQPWHLCLLPAYPDSGSLSSSPPPLHISHTGLLAVLCTLRAVRPQDLGICCSLCLKCSFPLYLLDSLPHHLNFAWICPSPTCSLPWPPDPLLLPISHSTCHLLTLYRRLTSVSLHPPNVNSAGRGFCPLCPLLCSQHLQQGLAQNWCSGNI